MITPKIERIIDGVAEDITDSVQQPITINQRLDRELDSGDFNYIKYDEKCQDSIDAPLSNYRITLFEDESEPIRFDFIGTDTRTMLRGKFGNGDTKDTAPMFRHSVMLTEPTKLLEGILIDGFAVTQPEEESKRISLYTVLERLLQVTPLHQTDELQVYFISDEDDTNDNIVSVLKNTISPQFKWSTQTTLWECLCDIGSVIDAIPRLVASDEDQFIYVDFDLVNDKSSEVVQLLDNYAIDYSEEVDDSQFNTQLRSVVENIKEE